MFGVLMDQWSDKVLEPSVLLLTSYSSMHITPPLVTLSLSLAQLDSMTNIQHRKLTGLAIASLLPLPDEYVLHTHTHTHTHTQK